MYIMAQNGRFLFLQMAIKTSSLPIFLHFKIISYMVLKKLPTHIRLFACLMGNYEGNWSGLDTKDFKFKHEMIGFVHNG